MRESLTRRQQQVYDYLRENESQFDQPPTLDELCRGLGLKSRGSLHKHISALVDAGLVEPLAGRRRGLRLTHRDDHLRGSVPLLGYIAAGQPIEAIENRSKY